MLHIRVTSPTDLTDEVVRVATESAAAINVILHRGVAQSPRGDVVEFDLAREAADGMLGCLRQLGLEEHGSITVEHIDLSLSCAADAAEEAAPGYDDEAVIWDELDARTESDARMSWVFLAFLALATQLVAIGVLLDQTVLVVGAMVLGPEFGLLAAICFGALRANLRRISAALRTLAIGFAAAIGITTACAAVSRGLGWINADMLANRPNTEFIVSPDRWSFIVAILAGIAGMLSITAGKSSPLVGVFISVTTVPAAGNIALGIALTQWQEVSSSALQLGINLAGVLLAGTLTLLVQRMVWNRYGHKPPTTPNRASAGVPTTRR